MANNNRNVNSSNGLYRFLFYIILILPILAFSPVFYPPSWAKAVVFKITVLILLGLLLYQYLFRHKKINFTDFKKSPVFWAFAVFYTIFFIASIFSINPYFSFFGDPERGEGFINILFYGLFAVIAFFLLQKEDFKKMWIFSVGVGAIITLLSILSFYGFLPSFLYDMSPRLGATLGNPIPFGIYLLMLIFVAASLFFSEKNKKIRIFYLSSLILFLIALIITGSRGAYLGFLIGVFYFVIFYRRQSEDIGRKTIMGLKIGALAILLAVILTVLYATYTPNAIPWLSENRIAKIVIPRLSLKFLTQEERFKSWGTTLEVIKEKPILGWGPGNLAIGFDKHFDPVKTPLGWWDKAHNTFLDAAASAGILGLISYTGLFIVVFWQLQKLKNQQNYLMSHGMQASVLGYAAANFFSIDSFETFLIFFLITAFTIQQRSQETNQEKFQPINIKAGAKKIIFAVFLILAVIFAWQYNIKPFFTNIRLNVAELIAEKGFCKEALEKIEGLNLPQKMLGQYGVLEAEQAIKYCVDRYPSEMITYSEKALEIMDKSLPIYGYSSRLWILAGSISVNLAVKPDGTVNEEYIQKSYQYYKKALELSPKSQEVILKMAQLDIIKKDCQTAMERTEQCINLNPKYGACYWSRASAFICLKNYSEADENIEKAKNLNFTHQYDSSVKQIINAYIAIENYEKVAELYEFLVKKSYYDIQYRASLAEAYKMSKQYEKARAAALKIINVSLEQDSGLDEKSQQEIRRAVEAFLETLPQ